MLLGKKISVVIPCYKIKNSLTQLLNKIPPFIDKIYIIDDNCPFKSGYKFEVKNNLKKKIKIISKKKNGGVGSSVITGYYKSLSDNMSVIVKIDGDGQMNPLLIKKFVLPIIFEKCDYTKGNRFSSYKDMKPMPIIRIVGNIFLSILAKFSTGYYKLFDVNNGYTAISNHALKKINLKKINKKFFFESDILFYLKAGGFKFKQIKMRSIYKDEKSNLNEFIVGPYMLVMHLKNIIKRIFKL